MPADLSQGAFGPGVRPYTSADHKNWMARNFPAGYQSSSTPAPRPPSRPASPAYQQAPPPQADSGSSQGLGMPAAGSPRGVPVNPGNITGRLDRESRYNANSSSQTTNRATQDLVASSLAQSRANVNRGLESTNAKLDMQDQANRSAAYQQALSNQSRINADLAQREISQIDLASQLQQQMIRNQMSLIMALMQE